MMTYYGAYIEPISIIATICGYTLLVCITLLGLSFGSTAQLLAALGPVLPWTLRVDAGPGGFSWTHLSQGVPSVFCVSLCAFSL